MFSYNRVNQKIPKSIEIMYSLIVKPCQRILLCHALQLYLLGRATSSQAFSLAVCMPLSFCGSRPHQQCSAAPKHAAESEIGKSVAWGGQLVIEVVQQGNP